MSDHHFVLTRVNRVFVDFENKPTLCPDVVGRRNILLTVFCGAKQLELKPVHKKVVQTNQNEPTIINVTTVGKNALDFVLAHYLGRAVEAHPSSCFHIISADKGYDALVKHLKEEKVRIHRHDSFEAFRHWGRGSSIESSESAKGKRKVPDNHLTAAVKGLRKCARNRPAKRKTLAKFFRSSIGLDLTKQEAQDLINQLCSSGKISIGNDNMLTYEDLSR